MVKLSYFLGKTLLVVLVPILTIKANSRPQVDFLAASEFEVLYGGAAGGGKTWAMIVDPLRYVDVSDYRAIIFRENFPQLQKTIIPEAIKLYTAAGARWNEQKKRFTWGSGAFIDLGYLEGEEDWTNYQGTQYTGQYFDELTNVPWKNFEKLAIWSRAAAGGIMPYRRAGSNPGGVSHSQVKQYFVDRCPPLLDGPQRYSDLARMYWQPMRAGRAFGWTAPNGMTLTGRYIPARVFDNEDLLKNNPNYLAQLLKLDEQTRRAYLEGSWDVFQGQFFSDYRKELHVIQPIKRQATWSVCAGLDYGQQTLLEIMVQDHEGRIVVVGEVATDHQAPTDRANAIADYLLENELHNLDIVYDTNMDTSDWQSTDSKTPAEIFDAVLKQRMKDKAPMFSPVSKKPLENKNYRSAVNESVKEALGWKQNDVGRYERLPKLYFVEGGCPVLLKTFPTLLHDPDSPEGLDFIHDPSVFDHAYDALKYGFMRLWRPADLKPKPKEYATQAEYVKEEIMEPIVRRTLAPRVNADTI